MIIESVVFLGAALLVFLFARLLPSYHIDALRNDLFAIRNDLFDYVAKGSTDINFDSYVYGHIRGRVNALIRSAHKMGFVQFLVFRFCGLHKDEYLAKRSKFFDNKLTIELAKFNHETNVFIEAVDEKINAVMLRYFVKKSLFITLGFIFFSHVILKLRSARSICIRARNGIIVYLNDEIYSSKRDFAFAM